MKNNTVAITISALALIVAGSFTSQAKSIDYNEVGNQEKNINIGVGSYAVSITSEGYGDDELGGYSLSASYGVNNNVLVNGQYFSVEHAQFSLLEATGFDTAVYFGTGLIEEGFKIYIGAGFYSETWSASNFDENFSGTQLKGGIGYNFEYVALDLVVGLRNAGDYEELVGTTSTAASSNLTLSVRY